MIVIPCPRQVALWAGYIKRSTNIPYIINNSYILIAKNFQRFFEKGS
jgi:hypothetical protein